MPPTTTAGDNSFGQLLDLLTQAEQLQPECQRLDPFGLAGLVSDCLSYQRHLLECQQALQEDSIAINDLTRQIEKYTLLLDLLEGRLAQRRDRIKVFARANPYKPFRADQPGGIGTYQM